MASFRATSAIAFFVMTGISAASAEANPAELHVSGKTSDLREAILTIGDLEALGSHTITTQTPWHDGAVTFEGALMSRLMEKVGVEGETAFVVALNDYSSEVPLSDFEDYDVILAYKMNGEYMNIASKGPFFIVYPFDNHPKLHSELYYSRSVWQVKSIEIE